MPRHLKLIARFANLGLILLFGLFAILGLFKGHLGAVLMTALPAGLLAFNLYLIEKSARALSEEEWLQGEIRKTLLRRKLSRLRKEDEAASMVAPADGPPSVEPPPAPRIEPPRDRPNID